MTLQAQQHQIGAELGVAAHFDPATEIERRVAFLADYLVNTGLHAYVLGISGGVDSLVAGRLAQLAVQRVRERGHDATFIAVRLPYGNQRDEAEAARALEFIAPDESLRVDIAGPVDAQREALRAAGLQYRDEAQEDFVIGNVKARQRMIVQYAIAGARGGIVIGTDHAAEALMGFFTKFGDGAADVVPLSGLTKRRVRAVGAALGAPQDLVMKVPTADLETLSPGRPDEDAFGITYAQIDDFLEGNAVEQDVAERLVQVYANTAHKRALPVAPASDPV